MPNEKFTQLPTVTNASLSDIICAVQGGISSQETLSQVNSLFLSNTILSYAGNPNSHVAGSTFQLLWDTSNSLLYICTTTGSASTAVWTQTSLNGIVNAAHGGTGVASPTAHTIPVAEGSSNFTFLSLTDGQVLIGSTGSDPVPATLTEGANISITEGAGTITISATGAGGFAWSEVTGTSQSMSVNHGYVANNAALVTLTLPATSAVGDELAIVGKGAGGWLIAQAAGQQINLGSSATTLGATGSLASTDAHDSLFIVCTTANTTWTALSGPQGNITVA